MMGGKLDKRPSQSELRRVAVHESGHALLSEIVRRGSVSTLTVTPRGNALGYMRQSPDDDTYLYTKEFLENQIAVMLAGLEFAEEVILGNRSTGASNDFEQAVRTADTMLQSGMTELGVICPDILPQELKHKTITGLVKEQEERVRKYIVGSENIINQTVEILLEEEKITGEHFREIMDSHN